MSTATIRLAVIGASGRMGREIIALLSEYPRFALTGAVVSATSAMLGAPCSGSTLYSADLNQALANADLALDFSSADATPNVVAAAMKHGVALVLGSTGHGSERLAELRHMAPTAPILVAPNTSRGVHVMRLLTELACKLLPGYDVEVFELHHRAKADSPSGTAKSLVESCGPGRRVVEGRTPSSGVRATDEIGTASLRGGDCPGEHTVFLLGPAERVEITHRVRDRAVFARGAIELGELLVEKGPGWYAVDDLITLDEFKSH